MLSLFRLPLLLLALVLTSACKKDVAVPSDGSGSGNHVPDFYWGADLSYLNEMEACGAFYKDAEGHQLDPYTIFTNAGANLVRYRLWHNPTWTNYSDLDDVKYGIHRAKAKGLNILLDFHYSDSWADPENQKVPAAWAAVVNDTAALGDSLFNYTYRTLMALHAQDLLPEVVQIGNEINGMILQADEMVWPIDWDRNAYLLNSALAAVRKASHESGKPIETLLHIAQPENALWWFAEATAHGVSDFDWIGLSYYPSWSSYGFDKLPIALDSLINTYGKKLMVVETAYPFTLTDADNANNILGTEALLDGYPATQQGQLDYLNRLQEIIASAGGKGLVYWEPAWVSTNCSTQWGQGSHWDNATLFDREYRATLGMAFYIRSK